MNQEKNRILIVAHYHEKGLLRSDTIEALALFNEFFGRTILVSTNLKDTERQKVSPNCEIIVRDNIGYDFYSYRAAILLLLENSPQAQLTFMNTSFLVFEPQKLLRNYFEKHCTDLESDFLGLTMSNEEFPHVQTYLFTMAPDKWSEAPFISWWKDMEPIDDRLQVIKNYELGLSDFMVRNGVAVSSAFQHSPTAWIYNPTHGAAEDLFEEYGILKLETYRNNPYQLDLDFLFNENAQERLLILKEGLHN